MAFLDDLIKAGATFNEGIQAYQVGDSIRQATVQVNDLNDQLNQGVIKDMEARKQQQKLANDLAARLTQLGANSQQISQAFSALSPKQYGSAAEAFLAGEEELAGQMGAFEQTAFEKKTRFQTNEEIRKQAFILGKEKELKLALEQQKAQEENLIYTQGLDGFIPTDKTDPKLFAKSVQAIKPNDEILNNISTAVNKYKDVIKKHGTSSIGAWSYSGRQQAAKDLKQAEEDLFGTLKKFTGAGASLTDNEIQNIKNLMGDIGFFTSESTANRVLDNVNDMVTSKRNNMYKAYRVMPKARASYGDMGMESKEGDIQNVNNLPAAKSAVKLYPMK